MKTTLPFTATAVAAALLAAAPRAPAETYYWKAPDATWGDWGDLSNWSTNGVGGADAAALPGAGDRLFGNVAKDSTRQFDLGGGAWTIDGWNSNGNWDRHYLRFRNGTLLVAGIVSTHSDTVHLDEGASLVLSSNTVYTASYGHGAADQWRVHSGASLAFLGPLKIYKADVEVDEGGTFVLDSRPIGFTGNPAQTSYIHNSGAFSLPSGLVFSSGGSLATFRIRQLAGTLSVGGDVSDGGMAGTYQLTLEGGTVAATADARFSFGTMSIPAGTSLTNDVAAGATLDLTGFTGTADAEITKTGAGTAAFAAFPATLVMRGGAVTIPHAADRTLRTLVVESGATFATPCERLVVSNLVLNGTLAITKPGLSAPTGCETGSVTVDLADFHEGDLVFSTANATLRAKARAAAETAAAGTNFSIEESGGEIRIAVNPGTSIFNSTVVSDMSDPAGWFSGSVPPAGADVLVSGAGVVAELNAACPAWRSIEALEDTTIRLARDPGATELRFDPTAALVVKGGFALTVSGTPGTENVRLEEGATLALADGATVSLGDAFAGTACATNLPVLSVPTNATLRVPGGFGFKNVALSASGTIEATTSGSLTFGAASAGETAWFGLSLDGATVVVPDGDVCFADPDDGGTVRAAGTWLVRGTTFDHGASTGFNFARNNPTSEVVEIVFDDTVLSWTTGRSVAGGGVHTVFRNGSQFYRSNKRTETALTFQGRATFEFLEGTRFKFGYGQQNGSHGGNPCAVQPDEDGHVSLIFDGAVWEVFRSSGGSGIVGSNGKGVVEVRGECLREITYHPGWNWRDPFIDQKEVRLDEGAALTVVVGPYRKDGSDQEGRLLPETVSQRVPFTGAGSFCFSNATPATARAYKIRRSDNTATGTLSAAGVNASLIVTNGANWAGIVVADGNVRLVGAADDEPAEVSFGGLECRQDFPVRIWGEGTRAFAKTGAKNDRIHFGETGFLACGGTLVVDPLEGCAPIPGAKWYFGTIPAAAPGPELDGAWRIVRKPSDEAGVDDLWLAFGKRTMMIFR